MCNFDAWCLACMRPDKPIEDAAVLQYRMASTMKTVLHHCVFGYGRYKRQHRPSLPGPAAVADGSGAALHPRRVARRSRAPRWRSEARVARAVTRPSPEARPVVRAAA
eukprot:364647-Chlamydomonas_euryale.AAC.6